MSCKESELTSFSIDKDTVYESQTVTQAAIDEARSRNERALSNEKILKGDILLGTYEVLEDAISGGMGSVWCVHHQGWGIELAMKRPQPRFFAEGSARHKSDFISECENWIKLGLHQNVVACYYVREIGGVPTIFSEWMDNGSIKDRICDGSLYLGSDDEVIKRILDIAIQSTRGLAFSHGIGLVHQDIKPANILLSHNWDAKIADFGLARARAQLGEIDQSKSLGYTLEYCPAEQVRGDEPEEWMDLFAWALTVLEMILRKRSWKAGIEAKTSIDEIMEAVGSTIPMRLKMIIRRCVETTETKADEVVTELEEIYAEEFGCAYPRMPMKHEYQTASALNNTALSYLDLNRESQAVQCWDKAKVIDGRNADVIYNYALYQWRKGQIDANEAVDRMKIIDDVYDRERCIAAIQSERDGTFEVLHEGDEPASYILSMTKEEQAPAFEIFDDCLSYMEGEYVNLIFNVNENQTAAWMLINRYILFVKNLVTGKTTCPIYAKDYGKGHFAFIKFFNKGKYVAGVTSNVGGDYLNIWESESGKYIDSVPFSIEFEEMDALFKYGGMYYPGKKSDYSVSRIENLEQRYTAEMMFKDLLRRADEAYADGDIEKAFTLIEETEELAGFKDSKEAILARQRYGAKLQPVGLRRIVMTEELVPEQALRCFKDSGKLLSEDGEYSISIEKNFLHIYDSTFPGGWSNNAIGDNIVSSDFVSKGARIIYGDREGFFRMLVTAPFSGYRVGGDYRLRQNLFAPCTSETDNGIVFALDENSFAIKQDDGYHRCLIDNLYSVDEAITEKRLAKPSAKILSSSGILESKPGDIVCFGSYVQKLRKKEPIAWIILDKSEDEALLLMEKCFGPFGEINEVIFTVNYKARVALNEGFMWEAFDEDERNLICDDKVCLLSQKQMEKYLPETRDRLCEPTPNGRAGGIYEKGGYARWLAEKDIINYDGTVYGWYTGEKNLGLRPVIRIKLKV